MDTITISLVRVDGQVDEDASRDAFDTALAKHIAERETETATIAAAVGKVFDQYKGTSINMPALCNFALAHLNAQPQNYKVLQDRTAQYVRDNSQGEKTEGVEANPSSLFVIGKGKGGGVHRRADRAAKPAVESK